MKVVLANNRYFMVGGTTRYVFNIQTLLEENGHEVIPFSNLYTQTIATPWSRYFVRPPGGVDAPFFKDAPMGAGRAWSLFKRSVYDFEVRRAIQRLIEAEGADVAYSVNICNFLGPSVIDGVHRAGVPYVMRLSDFNLTCPAYLHLREGSVCEECRGGLRHAIRYRCLQGSVKVSLARVLAMWIQRAIRVYHRVDRIVTPSAFLKASLAEAGFEESRIHHIPSFVDLDAFDVRPDWGGHEVFFSGRIAPEKGPETLIRAASRLPRTCGLKIVFVGGGDSDYIAKLKTLAAELAPGRVEFAGFLSGANLIGRLSSALAVALPARWFENMPNAITEAMALGRPVLSTGLGSLPEQVEDRRTGRILPIDDPEAWAAAMLELWEDRSLAEQWGRQGRDRAEELFSPSLHYQRLMKVFELAGAAQYTGGESSA